MSKNRQAFPKLSTPEENLEIVTQSWVEKHRSVVFTLLAAIVVVGALFAYIASNKAARENQAALAAMELTEPDQLLQLAEKYLGTDRAAVALIQAISGYNQRAAWTEMLNTAEKFLNNYPKHQAAPTASIAKATALLALGKRQEALEAYLQMAKQYPASFRAPEALLQAGKILQEDEKIDDARQIFQQIIDNYAQSIWAGQARTRIAQLPQPEQPPQLVPTDAGESPVTAPIPVDSTPQSASPDEAPLIEPEPAEAEVQQPSTQSVIITPQLSSPEEAPLIPPEPAQ